jgi:hypothetical protein
MVAVAFTRDQHRPWMPIGYATALIILSLQRWRPRIISHASPLHGLFHVFAFGILCVLATREVSSRRWELSIALGCFLFCVGIETAQHLLEMQPMEWNDVVDDGIGIGVAGWLIRAVRSALIEQQPFLKNVKFTN